MNALKSAVNDYAQRDFSIVLNKYINHAANKVVEDSKNKKISSADVSIIMNTTFEEFKVEANQPGKTKNDKNVAKCEMCKEKSVYKKKSDKFCSKCYKKSIRPEPMNKGEDGEVLKCIHEKKATKDKEAEPCGKNCCVKSNKYCATHFKSHEKEDVKKKSSSKKDSKKTSTSSKKKDTKKTSKKEESEDESESESEEEGEDESEEEE